MEIKKIYTENPFVDSLLYCIKLLAFGAIIKSSEKADLQETAESIAASDLYMISLDGKGVFELYTYTQKILELSSVPKNKILEYSIDNSKIPLQYHEELLKIASQYCIDNYIELNSYYRTICGLPPIGDYGIPIKNYEYLIPEGNEVTATYVHELGADGAKMLELYGILDVIKADYPDAEYLNYITAGISIYKARKALDFQILYLPETPNIEIDNKFKNKYDLNREFVVRTIYSDAFKIKSDYYDNFIMILIMILTIVDMLSEVQEHIIKKDILYSRCIEYIFSMYGIPYFHEIPLKYQTSLCKNVNSLIKYKSCKQGMLNLISLFGMDDIEVFKYFILKDRKTDIYGNFLYNVTTKKTSKKNDVLKHERFERDIPDNVIPYPFPYILQKGNILFVWLDDKKLTENVDYYIYNYDKIAFNNDIEKNAKKISYDFYYDINTKDQEYEIDPDNGVSTVSTTFLNTSDSNKFSITPPYPEYFIDKNMIIVSVAGIFLDKEAYTIDITKNEITIDSSFKIKNRHITYIFVYGKNLKTMFRKYDTIATTNNQTRFTIPEPFTNYVDSGNGFFVTLGSTFIDPRRYTIDAGQIVFNDLAVDKDRSVSFHFIYSADSIYSPINLIKKTKTIKATQYYQYEFNIDFPVENYLAQGYRVYIKLRGWYLSDDYYDIFGNKIVFRDRSIALHPDETMDLIFIYGPVERNVIVTRDYRIATTPYQDTFDISYPISNFIQNGYKVIIDVAGTPLVEGTDFRFNSDYSKCTITNKDFLPYTAQKLTYTFVYNKSSDYCIKLKQQIITATEDGQKTFYLTYPFYPYLETGQNFLVLCHSLIVSPSLVSVNGYECRIDIDNVKKDDQIVILYIFNNKYLMQYDSTLTVEEKTVDMTLSIDDDLAINIPTPFPGYLESKWPYFIDSNRSRIMEDDYEVISGGIMFENPKDILNYSTFTFTFIYKEKYVYTIEEEDLGKDIDLRFVKIPLNAVTNTDYIKKKANTKSYDGVTLSDKFWDGEDNQDNAHDAIKAEILKKEFNYARTKYMTIEYLVELTEMAFQLSYFYNILYDDVFREDLLTIKIPSISTNKSFKLSNLFCYMTALSYLYSGIKDTIMDTPSKILYIKGFNFKTDLNSLRQFILDQRRLPSDYDVFGFKNPANQIPSIEEFIDIYKNNKNVWKTICYGMNNARDYEVYSIWKKLYDSLMVWEFNLEFFKLSNGKVAPTFTKFLQEKDNVLYISLQRIANIQDKDTRENEIITMISDIVYLLEAYIDSKEFKYLYNTFPGTSGQYVLQYLFTTINFFKSYKIVLKEMVIQLKINDESQNTIRPIDTMKMTVKLDKPDYITLTEDKYNSVYLEKEDSITKNIKEKINFRYYQTN